MRLLYPYMNWPILECNRCTYLYSTGVGGGHTSGSLVGSSYWCGSSRDTWGRGLSVLKLASVSLMSFTCSNSWAMSWRSCQPTITSGYKQQHWHNYSWLPLLHDVQGPRGHTVIQVNCLIWGQNGPILYYGPGDELHIIFWFFHLNELFQQYITGITIFQQTLYEIFLFLLHFMF